MTRSLIFSAMLTLLSTVGCDSQATKAVPDSSSPRTVRIQLGKQTFTLEIADTDESREHGLMQRETMPEDHGMIFVFADERPLSFWMKNTSIPLDIIFINGANRIVSIHQMTPFDLSSTRSAAPAKYAIELNQGAAADAGLKAGDEVPIPPAIKEPAEK